MVTYCRRATLRRCAPQVGNRAGQDGAGLFMTDGGTLTLNATVVRDNVARGADSRGGGVFVQNTSVITVQDATVVRRNDWIGPPTSTLLLSLVHPFPAA